MKCLRDVNGFLTERAVGDQQHLIRLHLGAELFYFFDQIVIDLEAAGGVEDDAVGRRGLRSGERGDADRRDILGISIRVEAEFLLLGQNLQLIDRGGAINVARGDEWAVAAFF